MTTPLMHQSVGEVLTLLQAANVLLEETHKRYAKGNREEGELWRTRNEWVEEAREVILDELGTRVLDSTHISRE
jgi:hypothetical protein